MWKGRYRAGHRCGVSLGVVGGGISASFLLIFYHFSRLLEYG